MTGKPRPDGVPLVASCPCRGLVPLVAGWLDPGSCR